MLIRSPEDVEQLEQVFAGQSEDYGMSPESFVQVLFFLLMVSGCNSGVSGWMCVFVCVCQLYIYIHIYTCLCVNVGRRGRQVTSDHVGG